MWSCKPSPADRKCLTLWMHAYVKASRAGWIDNTSTCFTDHQIHACWTDFSTCREFLCVCVWFVLFDAGCLGGIKDSLMISHFKQQPITEQENDRAKPKDRVQNPKCQCAKSQTWMTRCELHITEQRVYYRGSVCAYMWYWRCVCVFTSHRESTCFGRVTAAERTWVLPAWTTFTSVSFSFHCSSSFIMILVKVGE